MNATLRTVAERDRWVCWLCGGDVDAAATGTPWAASVDHVVPKSRGGSNDQTNLRLAHKRCNGRRGSRIPELQWPARFGVLHEAPLWQALQRAARRPGQWETVAVVTVADTADTAADWVTQRAELVLGGAWESAVTRLSTDLYGVRLRGARLP